VGFNRFPAKEICGLNGAPGYKAAGVIAGD